MWSSWPWVKDQVHAGVVVVREEHAAVDDEELAPVLDDGHVAADLSETPEGDDPHPALGQRGRDGQLGVGVAHISPDALRPARTAATWSGVASTSGRRTAAESMTPSSLSAALAMMAPWVMFMIASTTGTS